MSLSCDGQYSSRTYINRCKDLKKKFERSYTLTWLGSVAIDTVVMDRANTNSDRKISMRRHGAAGRPLCSRSAVKKTLLSVFNWNMSNPLDAWHHLILFYSTSKHRVIPYGRVTVRRDKAKAQHSNWASTQIRNDAVKEQLQTFGWHDFQTKLQIARKVWHL